MSHHARVLALAQERNIPLDVSIEITHHCNFRCRHCYIPDFSAPDRLMTELASTVPLSVSRREDVEALRAWADGRAVFA